MSYNINVFQIYFDGIRQAVIPTLRSPILAIIQQYYVFSNPLANSKEIKIDYLICASLSESLNYMEIKIKFSLNNYFL